MSLIPNSNIDSLIVSWLSAGDPVNKHRVARCQRGHQPQGSKKDNRCPLLDYSHRVVAREDRLVPSDNGLLYALTRGLRKALPMPTTSNVHPHALLLVDLDEAFHTVKSASDALYLTINQDHWIDLRDLQCACLLECLSNALDDSVRGLEAVISKEGE